MDINRFGEKSGANRNNNRIGLDIKSSGYCGLGSGYHRYTLFDIRPDIWLCLISGPSKRIMLYEIECLCDDVPLHPEAVPHQLLPLSRSPKQLLENKVQV